MRLLERNDCEMPVARKGVTVLVLFAVSSMFAPWTTADAQATAPQSGTGREAEGVSDKPPEFEVASIKLIPPGAPRQTGIEVYPGGRVVIYGAGLKALTATAFHLSYWQVSGGDAWTAEDGYNIEAKPPEGLQRNIKDLRHTLFDIEDVRLRGMLQALLIDRFHLKYHREAKNRRCVPAGTERKNASASSKGGRFRAAGPYAGP
jgi:Protein of unknown function (DUF3738)